MSAEDKIIEQLSRLPSIEGYQKLSKIRNVQLSFLTNALLNKTFNKLDFQKCIEKIFQLTSIFIHTEKLSDFPNGLVVITNHLGLNKLTKIYPTDISKGLVKESVIVAPRLENDDPFILLLAPITEYLTRQFDTVNEYEVIYVFMRLEGAYEEILHSINAVTIERNKSNQYGTLRKTIELKTREASKQNKKPLIVIFPEGGTSGKSNFADPYTLLDFKKGYKLLAKDLDCPILPVAVRFDENINIYVTAGKLLSANNSVFYDKNYLQALLV